MARPSKRSKAMKAVWAAKRAKAKNKKPKRKYTRRKFAAKLSDVQPEVQVEARENVIPKPEFRKMPKVYLSKEEYSEAQKKDIGMGFWSESETKGMYRFLKINGEFVSVAESETELKNTTQPATPETEQSEE
jgi:hypothetical protein